MMNETEIDWMPMYMMAYIHYKTFNFLSQNRLIAEAYANYVLEDLKDNIHSKRINETERLPEGHPRSGSRSKVKLLSYPYLLILLSLTP